MRDEGTGTSILLETERLFLREMDRNDYDALYRVLADTEIMRHYPYTFDEARVRAWIERNMERYRVNGFGLWAVCLKGSGEMIGDCGFTLQTINGNELPEIGYHIRRDFQRRGYDQEAAKAVLDWVFRNTDYRRCTRIANTPMSLPSGQQNPLECIPTAIIRMRQTGLHMCR